MARRELPQDHFQVVFDSAAALFDERGYVGTSLTDVLERASVSRAAFNRHFPNKEAVAVAVVRHMTDQWPPFLTALRSLRGFAVDTVVALSFEIAERFRDDVVVRAGVRLALERDTIKESLPSPVVTWRDEIEDLLSPAGRELMGMSVPGRMAANVIVNCLLGVLHVSSGPSGREHILDRVGEMWTVVLPGLRPTPDPSARIAAAQVLREKARRQPVPGVVGPRHAAPEEPLLSLGLAEG